MNNSCNCPKLNCERHGDCVRCEEYHKEGKRLPYCKRPKNIFPILCVSPVILLIVMYFIFKFFVNIAGIKMGYLLSMAFYWVIWCIVVPLMFMNKKEIIKVLKPTKLSLIDLIILLIPPILAFAFGPFQSRIGQANVLILLLSFLYAAVNSISEEFLWRGFYIAKSQNNIIYGLIIPTIGFAIWHFAPLSIEASSFGNLNFVLSAGFIGICWGIVSFRTKSIFWSILSHILLDFSGIGALFYFK